jgi:hypothetical protein
MMTASKEAPLSAFDVAELSGVPITLTRTHIGNIINHNLAYNLNPASRGSALYVWGMKPDQRKPGNVALPRTSVMDGTFTGVRWNIRERADQHKSCPSRSGDDLNPWAPPILIAGKPEQRV